MRLQLIKLDKLEGNVDSLSNRIANVELGLMFQIKIIGQKIKIIGQKKQNIQKIDFQTDFMKNLLRLSSTKEQVYLQEV